MGEVTRRCGKCKIEKDIIDFYKDISKSSGYHSNCKKCHHQNRKNYRNIHKEQEKLYYKNYHINNMEKIKGRQKNYYLKTKEDKIRRQLLRYHNDSLFRLKSCIRTRILAALRKKQWRKKNKTVGILGCTYEQLKQYLEAKFTEGMTWENHGSWHIDHIIPLVRAKNEVDLYKLCHYTNLQPLWAEENLKKNKY